MFFCKDPKKRTQLSDIRNERVIITTEFIETKQALREFYKYLYAKKIVLLR